MRIGILTFLNANNYGAAFQAFSLYSKLQELGFDAEMIDYRCPAIETAHSLSLRSRKGIKAKLIQMIRYLSMRKRLAQFNSFRNRFKKSCVYIPKNVSDAKGQYDIFITGSDQVFNLKLTGYDKTFFLDFVESKEKKVSYAASMGDFLDAEKDTYATLLKGFRLLSVREKSTALQIKEKLGIPCEVVPDPVFLHTAQEWKELIGVDTEQKTEPYVLIYALFESAELYRLAREYANKHNCKVIAITKSLRPGGRADRFVRDAGPKDFLDLIINAKYVVTDSFHGTAFSLIFNKQFKIVMPPKAQNRILDLLDELGIARDFSNIDYNLVNKKLDVYQNKGIEFLKKIDKAED